MIQHKTQQVTQSKFITSISHTDRNQSQIASESVEILDISLPITGDYMLENNLFNSNIAESEIPLN